MMPVLESISARLNFLALMLLSGVRMILLEFRRPPPGV